MRNFALFVLLSASVAWLIPYPRLLVLSAAVWIGVYFLTLPKPRTDGVNRRTRGEASER